MRIRLGKTTHMSRCFLLLLGLCFLVSGAANGADNFDCGRWKGTAEFLYWTAAQSELSYAVSSIDPEPLLRGHIAYLNFDWKPGVRVGGAYRFPCSCWEVGAEFTYVQLRADGPLIMQPPGGVLYTTLAFADTDNTTQAKAGEKIQYYLLDFLAKRPACFGWVTFSPILGVRLAQIDQHLHYLYFGDPNPINNNVGSADLDFKGIGLVGGCEGFACLCRGFSLFGSVDVGILAGRDDNRQKQDSLEGALGPVRVQIRSNTGKAVVDLRGGLQWTKCRLTFKAGYEFHHWLNVAQYVRFLDSVNNQAALPASHGHLSIHGLVLTCAYQL